MNPRSALVADRAAVRTEPPTAPRPSLVAGPGAPVVPKVPLSPERLAARRLIDQAKTLLITGHLMAEPEAYRWIQKAAMDRRTTMAAIAAGLIAGSDHPEPPAEETTASAAPTAGPASAQPVEAAG